MHHLAAARPAAVARSEDPNPRRAGLLAAAEAASLCGREAIRSVLVFAAGSHATATARVARGAAEHLPGATVVVLGGAGIVTPDGESEAATAVTAMTLRAPVHGALIEAREAGQEADAVGRMLGESLATPRPRPMALFCQPRLFTPALLHAFEEAARPQVVVGGGLAPEGRVAVAEPGLEVRTGIALAVRFDGGTRLSVGVSLGTRLLTDLAPIDEVDESFVCRVGGRRPLDLLTEAVRGRQDRPLVLAALQPRGIDSSPGQYLVRAISGVDPSRGAVHVAEPLRAGDRLAFATLDPAAARRSLEVTLREAERGMAGGVPLAAIYVDCAGRGARLHGRSGVDARILRGRLGELPFAGMCSSFEIGPYGGSARVQSFAGVVALLYAPS